MSDAPAALRAEAAAMMAEPEPAESAIVMTGESGDDLLPAVAGAVQIAGNQLCDRYRVTRLEPAESQALAGAMLNVARVYGLLDRADPKIMALLTLGGVGMSILGNRQRLPPPPEPAAEPANANAAAAA